MADDDLSFEEQLVGFQVLKRLIIDSSTLIERNSTKLDYTAFFAFDYPAMTNKCGNMGRLMI